MHSFYLINNAGMDNLGLCGSRVSHWGGRNIVGRAHVLGYDILVGLSVYNLRLSGLCVSNWGGRNILSILVVFSCLRSSRLNVLNLLLFEDVFTLKDGINVDSFTLLGLNEDGIALGV